MAPSASGAGTPSPALPPPGDAAELLQPPRAMWRCRAEEPLPAGSALGFSQPRSQPRFPRVKQPQPSPLPLPRAPGPGAHAGGEAVGGGGLVDLVGVALGVGAARCRLSLAPARGAAVHHAGRGGGLALLARERVALVCHHPVHRDSMEEGKDSPAPSSAQTPLPSPPRTPLSSPSRSHPHPEPALLSIPTLNPSSIPKATLTPNPTSIFTPNPTLIPL